MHRTKEEIMSRSLAFLGALAVTTVLGSTVALAQPQGPGYYAATPIAAPVKTSMITRDTVWQFRAGALTAGRARSPARPPIAFHYRAGGRGAGGHRDKEMLQSSAFGRHLAPDAASIRTGRPGPWLRPRSRRGNAQPRLRDFASGARFAEAGIGRPLFLASDRSRGHPARTPPRRRDARDRDPPRNARGYRRLAQADQDAVRRFSH